MTFVLADFVQSVPSPVTFALVALAEPINALKNVLQILSWRKSHFDGFLLIFAWWAICLFADSVLRYYLPVVLVAFAIYRSRNKDSKKQQVVTEQVLANTVSDLSVIPTLLPALPPFPAIPLRAVAVLYVPYLFITAFIPLRLIFAIAGSFLLTWRAPFAILLRTAIWRSAFVRWSVYKAWASISGQPLPPKSISPQTQTFQAVAETKDNDDTPPQMSSLRFLFTIYENQRWWMGLDWTAALLPGERPSWCSPTHAPLSPPGAFTLPEPSVVYLPHPSNPAKKIKRTAEWYWEEPEWTVLVRKEGGALSRVERPVPAITEDDGPTGNNAAATGSRLFKAASSRFAGGKDKDHAKDDGSSLHSVDRELEVDTGTDDSTNEPYTDPDGWVYGDNKWENQSNKGGISKYTRFRRWTRVAVLTEFVAVVDASEETKIKPKPTTQPPTTTTTRKVTPPAPINVSKDGAAPSLFSSSIASPVSSATNATTTVDSSSSSRTSTSTSGSSPGTSPSSQAPVTDIQSPMSPSAAESPLRQRLRNALSK